MHQVIEEKVTVETPALPTPAQMYARCDHMSTIRVAYYLHYVGRMALPTLQLIPRHRNSAIDDLNDAKEGDVLIAITVTPYSSINIQLHLQAP